MILALIALASPVKEEVFITPFPIKDWQEAITTAYHSQCKGCIGITASGKVPSGAMIAADKHWQFGECIAFFQEGSWKNYIVEDRGGDIKGKNRFDILMPSFQAAKKFGKQVLKYKPCE